MPCADQEIRVQMAVAVQNTDFAVSGQSIAAQGVCQIAMQRHFAAVTLLTGEHNAAWELAVVPLAIVGQRPSSAALLTRNFHAKEVWGVAK